MVHPSIDLLIRMIIERSGRVLSEPGARVENDEFSYLCERTGGYAAKFR